MKATSRPQKRAIFFVFDGGTGLGHLRRLACIAKMLQGPFACLIVTSHRAAAHWFVPPECEYIHLPAWDSLLADKAAYWGRQPFLSVDDEAALALRRDFLQGIVDSFKPDVMFVDHLPLGMRDELASVVAHSKCRKYLVTRGVQNETEDLSSLLLGGSALEAVENHYDRIFVAIDPRIFDFQARYRHFDKVSSKFCSVGYVVEPISRATIEEARKSRGCRAGDVWVVASAGGGQHGEALIEASCALARTHGDVLFDVVIGPRSGLSRSSLSAASLSGNLRLHDGAPNLSQLHAAADIVISSGGYNSLMETLQGNARIVCVPSRKSSRDEQYVHASRLARFAAIDVDVNVTNLPEMLDRALGSVRNHSVADQRRQIHFEGSAAIRDIVVADLDLLDI